LPSRAFRNPTQIFRVRAEQRCSRASAFSEEELKHARATGDEQFASERSSGNYEVRRLLHMGRLTQMCACRPLRFHLRRRKFSTIWPGIRRHKTPSTVSFTGGCSTPAFESGPRKLQRPSRSSSNEVFSNKANLRTATYFTAPPRAISQRFSNGHHGTLLLTQARKPSNKRGQSCLPH
jgi:hypothetical protein